MASGSVLACANGLREPETRVVEPLTHRAPERIDDVHAAAGRGSRAIWHQRRAAHARRGSASGALVRRERAHRLRPFCRLLEYGLDKTQDEALGLRLAAQANETPFGVVAHLLMHAPTLRDMLMLNSRFEKAILDSDPGTPEVAVW